MSPETTVVQTFTHEQFGEIRTVEIDGEIWFVAADVAKILGIQNVRQDLAEFPEDEKAAVSIPYTSSNSTKDEKMTVDNTDGHFGKRGGAQRRKVNIINEPGLYRLIFKSRKPEAKKFQRWVYHEVLPSIRKTGAYHVNSVPLVNSYFPPELSERWLNEKTAEALIQIAKLLKAGRSKEELLRRATVMLTDEDILANYPEESVRKI